MNHSQRINTLFVCSRNQWRSPTAERIFRNDARLNPRSCGVSSNAVRTISDSDIRWADIILVMESEHRSRIRQRFARSLSDTAIHVLDVPDEFAFMDPELVDLIRDRVAAVLGPQDDISDPSW